MRGRRGSASRLTTTFPRGTCLTPVGIAERHAYRTGTDAPGARSEAWPSCHAVWRYAAWRHAAWRHAAWRHAAWRHAAWRHAAWRHAAGARRASVRTVTHMVMQMSGSMRERQGWTTAYLVHRSSACSRQLAALSKSRFCVRIHDCEISVCACRTLLFAEPTSASPSGMCTARV